MLFIFLRGISMFWINSYTLFENESANKSFHAVVNTYNKTKKYTRKMIIERECVSCCQRF